MQRKLSTAIWACLATAALTGCEAMPSAFSDLRPPTRVQPSTPAPAPEIAERNTASVTVAERPGFSIFPQLSVEPRLSIGAPEVVSTESDALSLDLAPITPIPLPNQADLSIDQLSSPVTRVETIELAAVQDLSKVIPVKSAPPLSEQLNWAPSLSEPMQLIDTSLASSEALDEKISKLMSLAYVVDAQLYIQFRDLVDRLPEPARSLEIERQRLWLADRKQVMTQAFLEFEDENAARYNAAQAFLRSSHKRIGEVGATLERVK